MPVRFALVLLLALAPACAPAVAAPRGPAPGTLAALGAEVGALFDDTLFAHAHWGVVLHAPRTGETLYRRNGERLFIPASNMKLVTGAAALEALGPDFRYRTEVSASGPVQNGILRGDLVVRAGGDPTISARFHEDARAVFRQWADSLRVRGVRRVAGAVVGVDEYTDGVPYGRGWTWDDLHFAYSAPVSGLQLNDATVRLSVFPGRAVGEPALVSLEPATGHLRVQNEVTTAAPGAPARIAFGYTEVGEALRVTGQVPRDTVAVEVNVAVRQPARFFIDVLRETLRESGIQVDGPAVLWGDRGEEGAAGRYVPLFVHASAPMREILPAFMKPSQNQVAEILLKTLGRELRGAGSAAAGRQAVDSIFTSWGLPQRQLLVADGSGLSRYNFVSPDLLIALLAHMDRSPNRELWLASQPVAGIDGTLRARMRGTPAEGNVRAKTGTLSNVRALSGYVTTADGERLLFATIVNGHLLTAADADRLVDAALARIAGFRRN
jgi:serine-type D-Ala-D-Ala carboxypeptidase/endopeptidase (penicillin-binding protein 4)